MFDFLKNITPAQIAGGVLAGGLIIGGMIYVHHRYIRRGAVDDGGSLPPPATSVVFLNNNYQDETSSSSSDSDIAVLPAIENIGDAVGLLEREDHPEASTTAVAGSIERL
ncbi:hypothetical protein J6590_017022 [Homalodisca vitripennis]|nr:hypothetical protein J6590_017022 [Homalodisca vitripennis]